MMQTNKQKNKEKLQPELLGKETSGGGDQPIRGRSELILELCHFECRVERFILLILIIVL